VALGNGRFNPHPRPLIDILSQQLSLNDAQLLALRVLKQVMEEKLDHHNVQIAQVTLLLPICRLVGLTGGTFYRSHLQMDMRFWIRRN